MFRFQNLAHLASNLFMKQVKSNPAYVNIGVAYLVIIPRICLNPSSEEYSTMEASVWNTHFSNLPKVIPTSALNDTQLAVSVINEDDDIIVDL